MLTRRNIRTSICGPFYLDGFFSGFVSTVGESNELIDTNYDGIQDLAYDSDRFENAYVYVPKQYKADGVTLRDEEEQRVLSYSPASGIITIGRNFANDLEVGTYYEIHSHGLSPRSVNNAIDWACNNSRQDLWFMLGGNLFDGDMQYDDISYWSTYGAHISAYKEIYSNESIAKRILTTYSQYLNEYVYQTIAVTPGHTLRINALVKSLVQNTTEGSYVSAGIQCTFVGGEETPIEILWTGNTPVESANYKYFAQGLGEEFWGGQIIIPDNCYKVSIKLLGTANWSAVSIYDTRDHELPWPGFVSPATDYVINVGYYPFYTGTDAQSGVVIINAPPRPTAGTWNIVPAQYPGPLAVRAAVPFPRSALDGDAYPSNAENYIIAGAYRFLSTQLARPDTMDNTRFEGLRMKAERDWQAHSMSRNPLARSRMVWGRHSQ